MSIAAPSRVKEPAIPVNCHSGRVPYSDLIELTDVLLSGGSILDSKEILDAQNTRIMQQQFVGLHRLFGLCHVSGQARFFDST